MGPTLRNDLVPVPIEHRLVEYFHERDGGVLSGEELGSFLKISRTAVWKHVNNLKAKGYLIESIPSRGYRLLGVPDTMNSYEISAGLVSKRIGRRISCVREIDSTNRLAFRMAENGAEDGTVVISEAQTGGKGRLGRRWESPAGVNLYCSVILRPSIPPVRAPQLTFLSAVATARAIRTATGLNPLIKWPNDILINGYKVAGLLNEMSAETDTIHFVVLGIGVNINMKKEQFPKGLRHPASSLLIESGSLVARVEFARLLLGILDTMYDDYLVNGFASIRDEWIAGSMLNNCRVKVHSGDDDKEGLVSGIGDDGALLVSQDDGAVLRVLAGDVSVLH